MTIVQSCPIHGRFDITETECPICRKLERDARALAPSTVVASLLSALKFAGYFPEVYDYGDCGDIVQDDDTLRVMLDFILSVESVRIVWSIPGADPKTVGIIHLLPYEDPDCILSDFSGPADFRKILDDWSEFHGFS